MSYVRYIDKTRAYYLDQGYDKPYQWASHEDVPFTPLKKPLTECRIGLLSTSEIGVEHDPETEENPIIEEGFRSVYAVPADVPSEKLFSRTHSYDAYATNLDDVNSYFPVDRLREAVADGGVGSMPDRFCGAYNNYSVKKVLNEEAPKVLEFCRQDNVDAMVLVPV